MKGELTRGLCPGKCRTATARKTVLKVFLPSDTCWKIPLKVLPKLKHCLCYIALQAAPETIVMILVVLASLPAPLYECSVHILYRYEI